MGYVCYRLQTNPNAANVSIIADLYAEVIGVLCQSRSVKTLTNGCCNGECNYESYRLLQSKCMDIKLCNLLSNMAVTCSICTENIP